MTPAMLAPEPIEAEKHADGYWLSRVTLLWQHRRLLVRVVVVSFLVSVAIAFLIPRQYKSTTSILPPDQQGGSALMLAAVLGKGGGLGSLGGLASGLFGMHSSSALFVNLLESGTVRGAIINRFHLQQVYRTRYQFEAAKQLGHRTTIAEDKKSGVITITVEDTDPVRARDMAQAYLDELNKLLNHTSTSTAGQERIFIEHRLNAVQSDLEQAQLALSAFSSKTSMIDVKEQTRAMVDAGSRVEGELLVAQSGLQALRQIYGDNNVRVKETQARIALLQHQLGQMTGSSAPLPSPAATGTDDATDKGALYPPLRQLPRLAVPYADLYRRVRVQESVFELLTQQYEMARIEEAKDVPVLSVIDRPGIPERKSFPPRLLIAVGLTFFSCLITAAVLIVRESWSLVSGDDPRKALAAEIWSVISNHRSSSAANGRTAS